MQSYCFDGPAKSRALEFVHFSEVNQGCNNSVGRATPDAGVTSTTFGLVQLTNRSSDTFRTIQLSIKALF
jgi:hypothetical protein